MEKNIAKLIRKVKHGDLLEINGKIYRLSILKEDNHAYLKYLKTQIFNEEITYK